MKGFHQSCSTFSSVADLKKLNDRPSIEPTTSKPSTSCQQVELLDHATEEMFCQNISVFTQDISFQKIPIGHDLNPQHNTFNIVSRKHLLPKVV